jgi:hypothetical protein
MVHEAHGKGVTPKLNIVIMYVVQTKDSPKVRSQSPRDSEGGCRLIPISEPLEPIPGLPRSSQTPGFHSLVDNSTSHSSSSATQTAHTHTHTHTILPARANFCLSQHFRSALPRSRSGIRRREVEWDRGKSDLVGREENRRDRE